MTNEELQQLKKILADAPKCATHVCERNHYYKYQLFNFYHKYIPLSKEFNHLFSPDKPIRSLADIRTIVSQAEEIERLKNITSVLIYADETGYVEGEGFVSDYDELTEEGLNTLNKIKADAVREAAETFKILNGASVSDLQGYADKLEQGE